MLIDNNAVKLPVLSPTVTACRLLPPTVLTTLHLNVESDVHPLLSHAVCSIRIEPEVPNNTKPCPSRVRLEDPELGVFVLRIKLKDTSPVDAT